MYNIAFYQQQNMHTEIFGMFFEFLIKYKKYIKFTLYYDHSNSFCDYIVFYEKLFDTKIKLKKCSELKSNIDNHDLVVTLSSNDKLDSEIIYKYNYKIYYVVHYNPFMKNYMTNVISVSPVVKSINNSKMNYLLPIYAHYKKVNINKKNILSIIGLSSYNSKYKDLNDLIKVLDNYDNKKYEIFIFTRHNQVVKQKLIKYKNVKFFESLNSQDLMTIFRKTKFILCLAKQNGFYHNGVLTGSIPMGLNNNIPIILDEHLNEIYNLNGTITYKTSLTEIMDDVLNMNNHNYRSLVQKSILQKKSIIKQNDNLLVKLLMK